MLTSGKEILTKANRQNYAVGAFNVNNMEQIQAVISAAEQKMAPVILQVTESTIKYAGLFCLSDFITNLAEKSFVPIALHFDHGTTYDLIIQCIRSGFTSVMIDASMFSLDENIKKTKEIVKVAHACGVSVEAELGRVSEAEGPYFNENESEDDAMFTDPTEAETFVNEAGIDSLGVSIGNAHGKYRKVPCLNFERLREIKALVKIPLVLHGASGIAPDDLRLAIRNGINKVNTDTDLKQAFSDGLREIFLANSEECDVRKLGGRAREKMTEVVKEKINICGSTKMAL
ncbi:fructose-bisphosphate aldolase [Clostridia bacterium]|nr:fructose-bisphosphate aldolase [Clostridia bacterium]